MKLNFEAVSFDNMDLIYQYTSAYGEGSCQHSPVSMWSLSEKYEDSVCVRDGFLYVVREGLCNDKSRVYLAPLGDGDLKSAYDTILEDAHSYGKKAKFITLTTKHKDYLEKAFPGKFDFLFERDLSEYIYHVPIMLEFPGKVFARKRTEIRSFWRDYGERTKVDIITTKDLPEILEFEYLWLKRHMELEDEDVLKKELRCIIKQIDNYERLGLSGTCIRIDGKVKAFCYGVPLSEKYYDVLIEKGDRDYPGIYKVLRQESTRCNLEGFEYINFEEDLGVPGLRKLKESYMPVFMIEKYTGTEL